MNKIIAIVGLLFLGLLVNAQNVYYVQDPAYNANASDGNAGADIDYPWATWQKAFNTAVAGDSVYFRNGSWYPTTSDSGVILRYNPGGGTGNNGTYDNEIVYMNYPGETPIMDYSLVSNHTINRYGFALTGVTYVKFIGLTFQNLAQDQDSVYVNQISISNAGVIEFNKVTSRYSGGSGFYIKGYDTLRLTYFDSYGHCDSLAPTNPLGNRGGHADGYTISSGGTETDTFKIAYITQCRSWFNSDDGFDIGSTKQIQFQNCWSWNNGRYSGDGTGLKLSYSNVLDPDKRRIKNSIFAYNYQKEGGFSGGITEVNLYDETVFGPVAQIYNNFMYENYCGFGSSNSTSEYSIAYYKDIVANNIVYGWDDEFYPATFRAADYSQGDPSYVTLNTNTFYLPGIYGNCITNPAFTVTNADFISLDTTQLRYPRKADGSLPDIDFGKLAPNSDLIDGGTDVNLDYYGDAPDPGWYEYTPGPQIIADHTVIDDFDYIPQYYIDEVKKMMLGYIGESHAAGFRTGLTLLEADDATYQAEVGWFPTSQTSSYLRAFGAFWGDVDHSSGWQYGLGEEDWYWSSTAISRIKAGLTYINDNIDNVNAFGFGWCWDPDETASDMDDYVEATKEYIDYCISEGLDTKVFFSTGPVDGSNASGETGYNKYLAYEVIRDSVLADTTRILFDFADILCYDNDSETPNTATWDGHTYPIITTTNLGDESIGHIGEAGQIRLSKAMWWMLARIAGWDGNVAVYDDEEPVIDSTLTDILTFTIPTQTGVATINNTAHTVAIEVNYLATITNLTPYIAVSYGATISPESMTSRDFTTPQTYTVTALDGTTTQSWTVTVTQEEEPTPSSSNPPVHNGRWIVHEGVWVKI